METLKTRNQSVFLRDELLLECRAMAEYALSMGKTLPATVIEVIDFFELKNQDKGDKESSDHNGVSKKKSFEIDHLGKAHSTLSKIVEPAIPQSILLIFLAKQKGILKSLGPVPLVRQLMLVAIISLLAFIAIVLSPDINDQGTSIFNSEGLPLLINLIFLLTAAGLGSSFTALYKANRYITNLTFDPNHEASYWIRFLLGLISGLILSLVISDTAIQSDFLEVGIVRPLLAILGGFSADLVYTFLNRMVETVRSLFEGSKETMVETEIQKEKIKLAMRAMERERLFVGQLIKIQQEIGTETPQKEIKSKLESLLIKVMPEAKDRTSDKLSF